MLKKSTIVKSTNYSLRISRLQTFATSIKDNIAMGDKISDDRIWRALDELGLKQIVEQYYKLGKQVTRLNQDGLLMSGGQIKNYL